MVSFILNVYWNYKLRSLCSNATWNDTFLLWQSPFDLQLGCRHSMLHGLELPQHSPVLYLLAPSTCDSAQGLSLVVVVESRARSWHLDAALKPRTHPSSCLCSSVNEPTKSTSKSACCMVPFICTLEHASSSLMMESRSVVPCALLWIKEGDYKGARNSG